jgi:hypothetical protein
MKVVYYSKQQLTDLKKQWKISISINLKIDKKIKLEIRIFHRKGI